MKSLKTAYQVAYNNFFKIFLHTPGFYEESRQHFGIRLKKGSKKAPGSDFFFEFVTKVVATHPSSTGYLIRVFPESCLSINDPETMVNDMHSNHFARV